MEELMNKIYARINEKGIVIKLFSSVFEQPENGDIVVDSGNEEYHAHVHLKYQLIDSQGKYNYKVSDGVLIELTDEEKVDIDEVKQVKIEEINLLCEEKIINEFYSSCLGEKKRFDCTLTDQSNIMGLVAKAQMILASLTTDTTLDWKASGEPLCYPWTTTQVMTLGMDLFSHKTKNIKIFEVLRAYINTLTKIDEIKLITWDTVIPTV